VLVHCTVGAGALYLRCWSIVGDRVYIKEVKKGVGKNTHGQGGGGG
jgi:hypothetical protein